MKGKIGLITKVLGYEVECAAEGCGAGYRGKQTGETAIQKELSEKGWARQEGRKLWRCSVCVATEVKNRVAAAKLAAKKAVAAKLVAKDMPDTVPEGQEAGSKNGEVGSGKEDNKQELLTTDDTEKHG